MAELINWVKASPVKTPITQPIRLHVHHAFEPKSGTSSAGKAWSNQSIKVSDPGDPESEAIFATLWGGLDLRNDIGKVIKVTPGSKGGGIKVSEYNNVNTLDIGQAASVAIEGAPNMQQPAQQPQQGGQATMPQPGQPPANGYGQGPFTQPQEVVDPPQPAQPSQPAQTQQAQAADPRDTNLRSLRDMICGSANGLEIAMDASIAMWSRVNARHGIAPTVEDLRATAVTILIQAKEALSGKEYGSGAKTASIIPHTIDKAAVPEITGAQLHGERAALELMSQNYAAEMNARQQQAPQQPAQ